jgi:hypothetical protein
VSGGPTWFKAKTFGWGWGLASTWQGWLVYSAYAMLALGGWRVFPPRHHLPAFLVWTAGITLLLVAICYLKGEKPRWRTGGR